MYLDPVYYEAQERLGFLIEEKMKRAWASQIEVLEEIKRICRKHNITYYADWGTLLGAVRHGGYIPWDDDLDIGMLRDDYVRFLEVAPDELAAPYRIKSLYNDPNHDNVKCRVITGDYMNFDREYLDKFHNCPYVVGIDIFPIDYIYDDRSRLQQQTDMIKLVMSMAASIPEGDMTEEYMTLIHRLEAMIGVEFDMNYSIFHQLKQVVDMLSSACTANEGSYVCSMIDLASGWDYYVPLECYSECIELPFEYTTIAVPKGYDTILRIKYGDDYMTPRQAGGSHEYPFYKKQEQALREVVERELKLSLSDEMWQQLLQEKLK